MTLKGSANVSHAFANSFLRGYAPEFVCMLMLDTEQHRMAGYCVSGWCWHCHGWDGIILEEIFCCTRISDIDGGHSLTHVLEMLLLGNAAV